MKNQSKTCGKQGFLLSLIAVSFLSCMISLNETTTVSAKQKLETDTVKYHILKNHVTCNTKKALRPYQTIIETPVTHGKRFIVRFK